MLTEDQTIKDASVYGLSTYFCLALGVITGIVVRKLLGPTLMGYWVGLSVLKMYISYCNLGTLQAGERDIPYNYGKGDFKKAKEIKDHILGFGILMSGFLTLIIVVSAAVLRSYYPLYVTIGIVVMGLLSLPQHLSAFSTTLLRSAKQFGLLSKIMVFQSSLTLILTLVLGYYYKIVGLYVVVSCSIIFYIICTFPKIDYRLSLKISRQGIMPLLTVGLPLFLSAILSLTLTNTDKMMAGKMLGVTALGYYSIATMVHNYLSKFPDAISIVMFPRFQEIYGKTRDIRKMEKYIVIPTLCLAYLMPTLIGLSFIVIPLLVRYVLPEFVPGIEAMKVLLIGTFFVSVPRMTSHFLITLNKQIRLLGLSLGLVISNFILNYILIKAGTGILGVALATSITYFCGCTINMTYAWIHYTRRIKEILKFIGIVYLPGVYIGLVLLGLEKIGDGLTGQVLVNDLKLVLAKIVLFLLLDIPLLYYVERKTQIIRRTIRLFRR